MKPDPEVRFDKALMAVGSRHPLTFEQFTRVRKIAGEAVPQLHACLAGLGIRPAGPDIFEYHFQDSPHGPKRIRGGKFTLTIAVPVSEVVAPPAPLEFMTLGSFRYLQFLTNSFGDKWRQIRDFAEEQGFERSLVEREVYVDWKGTGHRDSKVALQVGIK